jgi:hypothetical protein
MTGRAWVNATGVLGVLAGAAAIAGGLIAHVQQPVFGIPRFFGISSSYLSGVHVLVGLGVVMVVAGALSFKWPSIGAVVVALAAMIGLIYTYNRGQYRWLPLLYYWGAPWVLAWFAGIAAGYAAYKNVPQSGERLVDARPNQEA